MGRGGSGPGSDFLRLPVSQSGPQHGPYPPVWLLSAAGPLRPALSRYAGRPDSLPGPLVSVLLPDRVPVCRECLGCRGRCGSQPSVTCGTEGGNKHFWSPAFSARLRRTLEMDFKRLVVDGLLGFNASSSQVSSRCYELMKHLNQQ